MKNLIFFAFILGTQVVQAATYYNNLWSRNDIEVCFAKGEAGKRKTLTSTLKVKDWNEKDKENIRRWINEEYSPRLTGIHFTGWKNCEQSPEADVIIFYNKNSGVLGNMFAGNHGLASTGPFAGSVSGYPSALAFVAISTTGLNKSTAAHEFGHIAGLIHEHNHPDAAKPQPACEYVMPIRNPRYVYEAYDLYSIMNECMTDNNSHASLSSQDRALLKRLYP